MSDRAWSDRARSDGVRSDRTPSDAAAAAGTATPPPRGVLDRLRAAVVIAVLRAPDAARARDAVTALVETGVGGVEITFTTPGAPGVIDWVRRRYADRVVVGAGTLTTPGHAAAAHAAGADFLVSPGHLPAVTDAMVGTGLLTMVGALTPGEVMAVDGRGDVDVVKLFPGSLGGPGYLRSLRGPFPDVDFMPTGGVSPENLADWVAAGAVAVGAGGELCPAAAVTSGDHAEIRRRAAAFLAAVAALPSR